MSLRIRRMRHRLLRGTIVNRIYLWYTYNNHFYEQYLVILTMVPRDTVLLKGKRSTQKEIDRVCTIQVLHPLGGFCIIDRRDP